MNKIAKFIVIAAAIALFSLSITRSERDTTFFQNLWGINYRYVRGNEQIIQKSDTQNGITVTIKEIMGDQKNVWIIYDIIKDSGEAFKSNDAKFDAIGVDFPNAARGNGERAISYGKSSTITRLMHIDIREPIHRKSGSIVFANLIEDTKNEAVFDLDISKFLKEHPELIQQASIINPEKGLGDSTAPESILPRKDLDIALSSCIPDTRLENIGFVDGRLHMRLKSTFGGRGYFGRMEDYDDLFFKDVTRTIRPIHGSGRGDNNGMYMYLVYEIKDVKELADLKPYVTYPDILKGKWKIPFKMDYKYRAKIITPNIVYDDKNKNNKCTIKEITLSPMSLNVFIEGNIGDESQNQDLEIDIFFKDGSKAGQQSTSTSKEENTIININFWQPINMQDVDYITVNNQRIKM